METEEVHINLSWCNWCPSQDSDCHLQNKSQKLLQKDKIPGVFAEQICMASNIMVLRLCIGYCDTCFLEELYYILHDYTVHQYYQPLY